jgi:type IV secretory pathway VirB10-like protein
MDRIITAALVRPYDSRATQQVVAQVDRNVYGAHGRTILIPRGSTLVGTAMGGSERVAISWTQIIRPDGARFKIEANSGDAMGQANVPGRINQRLMKRYSSILLGTALNVGVAKAFGASESAGGGLGGEVAKNNGAIISDIVRQDIQKIVQDIVDRNKAIQPIITVPAGTRITVIPTMDLQLRPLRGPEVQAVSYPRAQNAGAAAPRFDVDLGGNQGANQGGSQGGNQGAWQGISNNVPQQQARRQNDFLPPANAPATGATPPWGSN